MASAYSNRQNCACACKTLQTQQGRTHGAGCVRQWFRTDEPLGERRYENWNTHTQTCLFVSMSYISKVPWKTFEHKAGASCSNNFLGPRQMLTHEKTCMIPILLQRLFKQCVLAEISGMRSEVTFKSMLEGWA